MIRLPKGKVAVVPIFDPTHAGAEYADPRLGPSVDLWIPDESRERCDQGLVMYMADDVKSVDVGDYVIFSGYTGTLVNVDNRQLIILPEKFIICTLIDIPPTTIPGLYYKDIDGKYFTANSDMIMDMLARGIRDSEWHKKHLSVTAEKPDVKDYDKI